MVFLEIWLPTSIIIGIITSLITQNTFIEDSYNVNKENYLMKSFLFVITCVLIWPIIWIAFFAHFINKKNNKLNHIISDDEVETLIKTIPSKYKTGQLAIFNFEYVLFIDLVTDIEKNKYYRFYNFKINHIIEISYNLIEEVYKDDFFKWLFYKPYILSCSYKKNHKYSSINKKENQKCMKCKIPRGTLVKTSIDKHLSRLNIRNKLVNPWG